MGYTVKPGVYVIPDPEDAELEADYGVLFLHPYDVLDSGPQWFDFIEHHVGTLTYWSYPIPYWGA